MLPYNAVSSIAVRDVIKSPGFETQANRLWIYREKTLVFDLAIGGLTFCLDVYPTQGETIFSVLGRDDTTRRILRNALIGRIPMVKSDGERHILETMGEENSASGIAARAEDWVVWLTSEISQTLNIKVKGSSVPPGCTSLAWWDKRPNFGDAIGPWLVERIVGAKPINGRNLHLPTPPLFTVGSILSWVEQDGTTVWGSGLMAPLSDADVERLSTRKGVAIKAVRGELSRNELVSKLGWKVPHILGDPALLLPRFLPKKEGQSSEGKTVLVPHFSHVRHFDMSRQPSDLYFVDVEQGLEQVVQEIAAASCCVSTSLHGLIVAQAYGVPWVWIRLEDNPLTGDDFKFRDFFSTLDASTVAVQNMSTSALVDLDIVAVGKAAVLPELNVSLDDLLSALPLSGQPRSTPFVTAPRLHDPVVVVKAREPEITAIALGQISAATVLLDTQGASSGVSLKRSALRAPVRSRLWRRISRIVGLANVTRW
ncbi:hypothetical protein ABIB35_001251 [Arthrobacter sp. UYP6]|uniref:polysaccharide pyruvyl transferase family protein n=1 Tax=Arthrobacter sp. UYP6 TaxID=1756378 RepID=UPI003399C3BC